MADEDVAHEPPSGQIGQIRLNPAPDDASEGSGWSVGGVALAVLLMAVMVGALVIILWAIFQARA